MNLRLKEMGKDQILKVFFFYLGLKWLDLIWWEIWKLHVS